jgi:hypothetical protein
MGRQVAGATPKRPRTWRARLGQERRPSPPGAPRSRIPSPGRCYFGGEFISWAESDIVINLEKVNFIEVKRYIDEWLLSGAVFGWEAHSENVCFATCFHCFFTGCFAMWIVWHPVSSGQPQPHSRSHSHDFRVDEETRHKNSCPNIGVLLRQNEHWHDGRLLDGVFDDEA